MSLFVWYFGTRRQYPDVAHHTILLGPRYRELLDDIFERKVLAEDFSLYLHRPTATDPSLAPPGCDAFYVLSPVPHLRQRHRLERRGRAVPARDRAAPRARRCCRGLKATIVTSRMLTPQDFQDRLPRRSRAPRSALEPVLTQSAWFRPHNRSEEVDGLYLVGAGTHPGAGLPGVLSSARVLDTVVPRCALTLVDPDREPADLAACRAMLRRRLAELLRGVAAPAARACASRRRRSTRSAAWPTTRSTGGATGRRTRWRALRERLDAGLRGAPARRAGRSRASPTSSRASRSRAALPEALLEGFAWDVGGPPLRGP